MTRRTNILSTCLFWATSLVVCLVTLSATVRAERPTAPKMLPKDTLVYVRVHRMPELITRFNKTSMGKLANDEQIRPLLGQLYESAEQAFSDAQDELEMTLTELLAIPQGEVCFALVAPETGPPAVVAIVELGDKREAANKVMERIEQDMLENGARKVTEKVNETELSIYEVGNTSQVARFEREGVVCYASNLTVAKQLLAVWDGEEAEVLADNRKFVTIMKRSVGTKDERPQLSFFVDPIELAKKLTRGNFNAQVAMSLLQPLGLEGLKAIGGSVIFATEEFDSIMHLHVMLSNPREGVIKMIALGGGESTPEPWVPKDVASYTTLHWDVDETYTTLNRLFDMLRGEGEMQIAVDGLSERIGVNIRDDLVNALDGRVTMITRMQKPARINSQAMMLALKLKDAERFTETMDKLIERFGQRLEKKEHRGLKYYSFSPSRGTRPDGTERAPSDLIRRPEPCLAIVGDYLMATDSTNLFKEVVAAKSNPNNSLANELDYKLIANKINRQLGKAKPAMVTFGRPEEAMRMVYELATAEGTRGRLSDAAENNGFFRVLNDALNDNPLPPFSVIARYLAPTGGMITSDDSGIHYTTFGLKRKSPVSESK